MGVCQDYSFQTLDFDEVQLPTVCSLYILNSEGEAFSMSIREVYTSKILRAIFFYEKEYSVRFALNNGETQLSLSLFELTGKVELRESLLSVRHHKFSVPLFIQSPCKEVIRG